MFITFVSVLGILFAFLAVLAIAGLIVYTAIYNARIKRRLAQGITTGKQWPQPKTIVVVILIIALSIVCAVSVRRSFVNLRQMTPANINHIGTVESYLSYELPDSPFAHYAEAYKTGKLSGYTLTEATEGDFHYMYFRSESYFDLLHPSFVLFVKYVGTEDYKGYIDTNGISFGTELGVSGMRCGGAADYFCIIGNVNHGEGHQAIYQLALYATETDALEDFDKDITTNAGKAIAFETTEESVIVVSANDME